MTSNLGPGAEFGDAERQRLIDKLASLLVDPGEVFVLPPSQWAALWLSDLRILKNLVETLDGNPVNRGFFNDPRHVGSFLANPAMIAEIVLKPWNQRAREQNARSGLSTPGAETPPSLSPGLPSTPQRQRARSLQGDSTSTSVLSSPQHQWVVSLQEADAQQQSMTIQPLLPLNTSGLGRSTVSGMSSKRLEAMKKSCLSRDGTRCVLTRAGYPVEVAHIYPYSMRTVQKNGSFWDSLSAFWPDDIINKWKEMVFTKRKTEVCENLITLSPNAHAYWTRALFALKPLDPAPDGKSMGVQLFWLRPHKRPPLVPLVMRPDLPADLDGSMNDVGLFDHLTGKKLCSGDIITLYTDNPEIRPLPSKEILEMQWVLHRLTALSGGAEVTTSYYDSDDDDNPDCYCRSLDEIVELDESEGLTVQLD